MDFLNFFGFKEDPFKLTPDPAYFFPSSSHNEGLLLLDYSTEQKEGFVLVIGDPGTGKTTLLNVFLENWKSNAEIAMILTPRLSPEEFLVSVIEDLQIKFEAKNKNELIKAFRNFMIVKSSKDKRIVIVVDEAQNLPDETLEELRLLSNLETDKDKLLQIILIGQPELEKRLTTDKLRQLNQRITTRIHLQHFNRHETLDYIQCRLIKAGRKNLYIKRGSVKQVHKLSHGTPRLINMLISRALMAAYLEESKTIVRRHIHHAVKSLSHSEIKSYKTKKLSFAVLGSLAVLFVAAAGYIMVQYGITSFSGKTGESQKVNKQEQQVVSVPDIQRDGLVYNNYELEREKREGEKISAEPEKEHVTAGRQHTGFKFISVKVDGAEIMETPSSALREVGWSSKGSSFVVLKEFKDDENILWYQILHRGEKRWISDEVVKVVDLIE